MFSVVLSRGLIEAITPAPGAHRGMMMSALKRRSLIEAGISGWVRARRAGVFRGVEPRLH
jgi:hypothetical protein